MSIEEKEQVRHDYVRGYSARQLAAKYGVGKTTILRWIKEGAWEREKVEAAKKRTTRGPVRTTGPVVAPGERLATDEDYEKLRAFTNKLMEKAEQLLDLEDALAPRDLKSLSGMLLDVRQLLGILSPREAAEQEVRMIMLRKQAAEEEKKDSEIVVRFVDTEGAEE